MKLPALAILAATSASSALARAMPSTLLSPRSPVPAAAASATTTTSANNGTGPFFLRSKSVRPSFSGKYLQPYHTGAGLNDAVFTRDSSTTGVIPALLTVNGSLVFDLPADSPYTYGAILSGDTNYAGMYQSMGGGQWFLRVVRVTEYGLLDWESVQINIGTDFPGGYVIDHGKLVIEKDRAEAYGWNGWISMCPAPFSSYCTDRSSLLLVPCRVAAVLCCRWL